MRLRNVKGAKEKLIETPSVVNEPQNHKGKWHELFGNNHPIHIEIGMGKGRFVSGMAQAHPHINYIGIEKYDSVLVKAIEREESNQPNLRFIRFDAEELLTIFENGEIDRVYLNFSDPWPKIRHAKRRLTHANFLDLYKKVMVKDGEIHFKTDNQGLFEFSLESLNHYGMFLKNISLDLHKSDIEGNIMTEYEEKFSGLGFRIYRLEASFIDKRGK